VHETLVVKVVIDAKMVTVPGKIIPLVHIYAIPLVGHDLNKQQIYDSLWFIAKFQIFVPVAINSVRG